MSFTAQQYADCFDMAEFVFTHCDRPEIKKNAQEMMLAVEMSVGQLRTSEQRTRLGLGKREGVIQ